MRLYRLLCLAVSHVRGWMSDLRSRNATCDRLLALSLAAWIGIPSQAVAVDPQEFESAIKASNEVTSRLREYCRYRRYWIRSFVASPVSLKSFTVRDVVELFEGLINDTSDDGLDRFCKSATIVKRPRPWMTTEVTFLRNSHIEITTAITVDSKDEIAGVRRVIRATTPEESVEFQDEPGLAHVSISTRATPQFLLQNFLIFPTLTPNATTVESAQLLGNSLQFHLIGPKFKTRWTVDRSSGFPTERLVLQSDSGKPTMLRCQRLFKASEDGAIFPSVVMDCAFKDDVVSYLRVFIVDKTGCVDPGAGVDPISVPRHATIVDYRDDAQNPVSWRTEEEVPDVLAYANRLRKAAMAAPPDPDLMVSHPLGGKLLLANLTIAATICAAILLWTRCATCRRRLNRSAVNPLDSTSVSDRT